MKPTKRVDSKRGLGKKPRRRRQGGRTPKWLLEPKDLDAMAQRRCLMILSVLSGERSALEAAEQAGITPTVYYQMETRAVRAMVSALVPGASESGSPAPQITQLEEKIVRLEKDKRRLERLLFLTRQVVKPGPVKQPHRGRRRVKRTETSSESAGAKSLRGSLKTRPIRQTKAPSAISSPSSDGGVAPSNGKES